MGACQTTYYKIDESKKTIIIMPHSDYLEWGIEYFVDLFSHRLHFSYLPQITKFALCNYWTEYSFRVT